MKTSEKLPRQLVVIDPKSSPDGQRRPLKVSINIPQSASDDQVALIHSLFEKHFPDAKF